MKLKKILASVAAFAMVATAFSSVALANTHGSPELKLTVEYPYDFYEDPTDCDYLVVKVSYEGFENFSAYKKQAGDGITSIGFDVTYDSSKLSYEDFENGSTFSGATIGGSKPSFQWAQSDANMVSVAEADDFVVFVFSPEVDLTNETLTFGFSDVEIKVAHCVKGQPTVDEKYGMTASSTAPVKADSVTYPTIPDPGTKYAVNFNPADVTVTLNGTPIDANTEVDENETVNVAVVAKSGYTAQLKCNGTNADEGDFPVDQPLEFTVEYTLIPDPVSEYNFNVKDYGSSESAEAIYYKLGIFNSDTMMTLGLAGGKAFTAKNIPEVKGELELTMTYVMTGVPASIRASIPAVTSLTGVNNGEEYEEVK